MKKPETKFVKKCMDKIREIPYSWFTRIEQSSIRGTPDVIGSVSGVFVALEFKATSKSPVSKIQEYTLKQISESLGYGLVVHPDNFEEVYKLLINISGGKINVGTKSSSNANESKSNS